MQLTLDKTAIRGRICTPPPPRRNLNFPRVFPRVARGGGQ